MTEVVKSFRQPSFTPEQKRVMDEEMAKAQERQRLGLVTLLSQWFFTPTGEAYFSEEFWSGSGGGWISRIIVDRDGSVREVCETFDARIRRVEGRIRDGMEGAVFKK